MADAYKIVIKKPMGVHADVRMDWLPNYGDWMMSGSVTVFKDGMKFMIHNLEKTRVTTTRGVAAYLQNAANQADSAYQTAEKYRKMGWLRANGEIVNKPDNPLTRL